VFFGHGFFNYIIIKFKLDMWITKFGQNLSFLYNILMRQSIDGKIKKKKKKKKIITIIIFLIIFVIVVYWVGIQINEWWQYKKPYIEMGLASDKFPFRIYTKEEKEEMIDRGVPLECLYCDITTTVRPEETYAKFRKALIEEDFETASECFIKEQQKDWEEALYEIRDKGYLQEMLDDLPESIEELGYLNDNMDRNLDDTALDSYDYVSKNDPERMAHTISFQKDRYGVWKIEDL